jgi:hypothetical protein
MEFESGIVGGFLHDVVEPAGPESCVFGQAGLQIWSTQNQALTGDVELRFLGRLRLLVKIQASHIERNFPHDDKVTYRDLASGCDIKLQP